MKNETTSLVSYVILGVLAGYVSFTLRNNLIALAVAIAIFFIGKVMIHRIVGEKSMKWFLSNGGYLYFFIWFITWIILYNL